MTQKQLIMEYVSQYGSIIPAKMSGKVFMGKMFGSESSKRCRELREEGKLKSHGNGRFEEFYRAIEEYREVMELNPVKGVSMGAGYDKFKAMGKKLKDGISIRQKYEDAKQWYRENQHRLTEQAATEALRRIEILDESL